MKSLTFVLSLALGSVLALSLVSSRAEEATDAEVTARKIALDLAGAFGNEGFKLRDGAWISQIEKGKPQVIQVNLYAGNQYYFSLGVAAPAKRVAVTVYDEAGQPVEMLKADEELPVIEGAAVDVAGFSPEASGPYFIKVEELEGDPATFCLLYSYK